MSRVKGLILTGIGAAVIAAASQDYSTKYSNERIWASVKPQIEVNYQRDLSGKEGQYTLLRKGLDELSGASNEDRCRFSKRFEVLVQKKGDAKAAESEIAKRSFEPLSECKTSEQQWNSFGRWYVVGAVLLIAAGIYNLVRKKSEE